MRPIYTILILAVAIFIIRRIMGYVLITSGLISVTALGWLYLLFHYPLQMPLFALINSFLKSGFMVSMQRENWKLYQVVVDILVLIPPVMNSLFWGAGIYFVWMWFRRRINEEGVGAV